MKARSHPIVLSLVGVLLGSAHAWAADAVPLPYVFLDPAEPMVSEIRRTGESAIDRAGTALVLEVRRVLATTPTALAIGTMHLKDYKLPAPPPGSIMAATKLHRTSLRVRDPANAPDVADGAALELIKGQLEQGEPVAKVLVQRVTLPGQPPEWRVYRPLSAMKQCLECHGTATSLAPGVAARLQELYPNDAAVDYRTSEWRGLIRVSLSNLPAGK
jgi:hypothetical protein